MQRTRRIAGALRVLRSPLLLSLILLLALFAVAGATHFWLVVRAFYLVALLLGMAAVWTVLQHVGLQGSWQRDARRLMAGDLLVERLVLRNRMPWPKPIVEVQRPRSGDREVAYRTVALPGRGEATVEWRTAGLTRGRHPLRAAVVRTWDPFGIFPLTSRHGEGRELLVLPKAELLPGFRAPARQRGADGRSRRPSVGPTPIAGSVRPYALGDDRRLVHWPHTLRRGELMVKTFDTETGETANVVLDLSDAAEAPEEIVELAVEAAASIVRTLIGKGAPVSLRILGEPESLLERLHGRTGLDRALEALALVLPQSAKPTPVSPEGRLLASAKGGCVLVTTRTATAAGDAGDLAAGGGGVAVVLVAQLGVDVDGARAAIEARGWHAYHVHPEMPIVEALSARWATR